jgi:hypothetical protein
MTEVQYLRIQKYLKGKMDEESRRLFEQELLTNQYLSEQTNLQKLENAGLEFLIQKDLSTNIQMWERNKSFALKKKRRISIYGIIVLLISLFIYFSSIHLKNKKFIKTDSSTKIDSVQIINRDTLNSVSKDTISNKNVAININHQAFFVLAEKYWEHPEGIDFEDVDRGFVDKKSNQLDSLLSVKPISPFFLEAQYKIGCHLYLQKNYMKAIPYFEKVGFNEKTIFHENAKYYLAISFLATNKKQKAKNILKYFMSNKESDFYIKANELISEL